MMPDLKSPYPYFGGKSKVAELVWSRIGNVQNYVEPFFGSGTGFNPRYSGESVETQKGDYYVDDFQCFHDP